MLIAFNILSVMQVNIQCWYICEVLQSVESMVNNSFEESGGLVSLVNGYTGKFEFSLPISTCHWVFLGSSN